ncbi:MAG: hypothetical protein ACYTGX_01860 [Planctomycetota bacterium]
MATETCTACGGAVELPDGAAAQQFACPHCGAVLGPPPAELPPPPPSISNALDRDARAAAATESARTRGSYRPTTGRTDAGEAVALMGITLAVPAIFASPWLHPMALGFGGMGLCLLGLVASRQKLIPAIGILVGGLCTAAGVILQSPMLDLAIKLGLKDPLP